MEAEIVELIMAAAVGLEDLGLELLSLLLEVNLTQSLLELVALGL